MARKVALIGLLALALCGLVAAAVAAATAKPKVNVDQPEAFPRDF